MKNIVSHGLTGVINTLARPIFGYWQLTELAAMTAPYRTKPPLATFGSLQHAADTARATEPQMAIVFVAFPGTNFAGLHHYAVFMRGTTPLTTRLFKPVLVDAQTAELTATRELPWYVKALLVSQPLHFGDYGGMPLKIMWALLDIFTIVVLGSGLYLWLKRRNVAVEEWLGTLPNKEQGDAPVIATVKQGEPV